MKDYKPFIKTGLLIITLFVVISGFCQNQIIPEIVRSCKVDSLMLDAGPGFISYEWSNGDTTQTSWFSQPGDYSLTVKTDSLTITDNFTIIILDAFIVQSDTTIECGDTIMLSGSSDLYNYLWSPGSATSDSITVYPRDSLTYYATISDTANSGNYCIDSVIVKVDPIINLDTVKQLSVGCPDEKKARIKLEVSGGYPPYSYDWPIGVTPLPEDHSYGLGLTDGDKQVLVTDSIGCLLRAKFHVKAYPLPDLDLSTEPGDTVYLQKPYITFTWENPQYDSLGVDTFLVNWWQWNFGDSSKADLINPATRTYQKDGNFTVVLKFKTFYGCPATDTLNVVVKPVKLKIPTVFTPNGDGSNDYFEIWEDTGDSGNGTTGQKSILGNNPGAIDLSEYYISNSLIVINRWGQKVYEIDNYQNDWDGGDLKDGTYFYILKCHGEHRDDVYKGAVLILTHKTF